MGDGNHAHQHHDIVQLVKRGYLVFWNSGMWTRLTRRVGLAEITTQRVGHRQQSERSG